REMAADNRLLGQFNLEGIPPAPRGVPQIEVKFDIDANGILNVGAKDLGTGKEATVKIEQSSGLSDEEIKKMQDDAAAHAEEDKKKRELIEARNNAEGLAYQTEKTLKEQGEAMSDGDKKPIEDAIAKVREAAAGEDVAAIKSATEALQTASHAMSEAMYKAAAEAGPSATEERAAGDSPAAADDDVVDAEFEVKEG
ncbi:MAG: Hsp70 family protein, partial [Planctomycetota bacterium]